MVGGTTTGAPEAPEAAQAAPGVVRKELYTIIYSKKKNKTICFFLSQDHIPHVSEAIGDVFQRVTGGVTIFSLFSKLRDPDPDGRPPVLVFPALLAA